MPGEKTVASRRVALVIGAGGRARYVKAGYSVIATTRRKQAIPGGRTPSGRRDRGAITCSAKLWRSLEGFAFSKSWAERLGRRNFVEAGFWDSRRARSEGWLARVAKKLGDDATLRQAVDGALTADAAAGGYTGFAEVARVVTRSVTSNE